MIVRDVGSNAIRWLTKEAVVLVVPLVLGLLSSSALAAQSVVVIRGRVTSPGTGPVAAATVSVRATAFETRTSRDGRFSISMPLGKRILLVRRLGFQPESLAVDVDSVAMQDTVIVIMHPSASALTGVTVSAARLEDAARTVTRESLRRLPALAEPDLLRALPTLSGVSQPNDIVARIHIDGGASDEHAVLLDGHPIQSTPHVHSILGGFNISALESASVQSQHVPIPVEGAISGLIDLESRRIGRVADRELNVSVASTTMAVVQPAIAAGVDGILAARATYVGRALRAIGARGDLSDVPDFQDVIFKLAREWRKPVFAEMIGFASRDAYTNQLSDSLHRPPAYGENMIGARVQFAGARWHAHANGSFDFTYFQQRSPYTDHRPGSDALGDTERIGYVDNHQALVSATIVLDHLGQSSRTRFGVTNEFRSVQNAWRGPIALNYFKASLPTSYDASQSQWLPGAFVEQTFRGASPYGLSIGAHITTNDARGYLSPRMEVQRELFAGAKIALSLDRRLQFNAIASEPNEGAVVAPTFLLASPRTADQLSLSSSWRARDDVADSRAAKTVSLAAAGFARRLTNRAVLDSSTFASFNDTTSSLPGKSIQFQRNSATVFGVDVSADLAMRDGLRLQTSYTFQRAVERVREHSQAISWSTPHQFKVFISYTPLDRLSISSMVQLHSGTPVTPVVERIFVPFGDGYRARYLYGDNLSGRNPVYTRLDLAVRTHWRVWGARWTLTAQVINALATRNGLEYDQARYFDCASLHFPSCQSNSVTRQALPTIPSLGLEIVW